MKKLLVYFSVLVCALVLFPVFIQAQYLAWHHDRLIENNATNAQPPRVAMSGSKVVAVWAQLSNGYYRIFANYSTNAGATWRAARTIDDNTGLFASAPHVAMSGSNVVAVWQEYYNGFNRVFSNYSINGGATWHAAQPIEDNAGYHASTPHVAISGTKVVAVWFQPDGSNFRIYSNYSTNAGATWHSDRILDGYSGLDSEYPRVALSGSNAVAVWWRMHDGAGRIRSNCSSNGGALWYGDQLIEDNAGYSAGMWPRVAIVGTKAAAVWSQSALPGSCIFSNYSTDGGRTWHADQRIENYTLPVTSHPEMAMSGTRVVAVWSHQNISQPTLIYGNYSTNSGATWQSYQVITNNTAYGVTTKDAALSGSNAAAVWVQPDGSKNRINANYSPNGGATWRISRTIDGMVGTDVSEPRIAISGNKAVAVWLANEGGVNRVVANYTTAFSSQKYYLLPPKLNAPASGAVSVPVPVTFTWQDTNSDPQEIKYQIRIKPLGGSYTQFNVPADSTSYIKSGLVRNKTYGWNVRAVGNGTNILTSSWANNGVDWRFTTAK